MLPFVKMQPDSRSDEPSCSSQIVLRSPKSEKKRICSSSADVTQLVCKVWDGLVEETIFGRAMEHHRAAKIGFVDIDGVNCEVEPIEQIAICNTPHMDIFVSQLLGKVWDDLLEEAIFGLAMEHHRAAKMGFLDIDGVNCEVEPIQQFACSEMPQTDIFGQPLNARAVKQLECLCPLCNCSIAACRFAPHLEKCSGMGRCSTRVASRRAAATNTVESTGGASGDEESDQDADWLASSKPRHLERARKKISSANSSSKFHRATSGLAKMPPSAAGSSHRKPLAKLILPSSKQRRPESSFEGVAKTSSRKFSSPTSFATTSNEFAKFGISGADGDSDLFDDEIDSPRSLEL